MDIRVAKRKLIYGFVIVNIIAGTAVGALQMILPLYAFHLGANTTQIGLIRGIGGVGFLLTVLPAGFLIDRHGAKKLFLLSSLAGAVIIILMAFTPTVAFLLLLSGLDSVFRSMKFTALNSSFFKYLTKMGLDKTGWFKGSMSIGLTFLGVLLGGMMINFLNFGGIFLILFMITLLPSFLVLYLYKDKAASRPDSETTGLKAIVGLQIREFRSLLTQSMVRISLLTEGLSSACFATFSTFFAVVLLNKWGFTPMAVSTLLVIESMAYIVTVFWAGKLIGRITNAHFYLLSFTVSVAGLVGLSFWGNFVSLALSGMFFGLGIGLAHLVSTSRVGEIKGAKGKLAGLFSAATGIGISFGPSIAGMTGQYFGDQAMFLLFVPLYFLLGCTVIFCSLRAKNCVSATTEVEYKRTAD